MKGKSVASSVRRRPGKDDLGLLEAGASLSIILKRLRLSDPPPDTRIGSVSFVAFGKALSDKSSGPDLWPLEILRVSRKKLSRIACSDQPQFNLRLATRWKVPRHLGPA